MKHDEQPPMKIVGRTGEPHVDVIAIDSMQRMANELRRGRPFIPKGVHRFKTFEEADAWTLRMMTRGPNRASQP